MDIIYMCLRHFQKWCYANEDYKVRAVSRSNQGSQIELGEEQIGFMSSQQIPYPAEETRSMTDSFILTTVKAA